MRLIITFLLILIAAFCSAQDIKYARSVVDTLAAPGMHGRGYVSDGDKIAAAFIENEFKKLGLKSFGAGYRQEFTLSVNTFPDTVSLAIDKKALVPGKDFIFSPGSAGEKRSADGLTVVWIDSMFYKSVRQQKKFEKNYKKCAVVIDLPSMPANALPNFNVDWKHVPVIIEVKDKLTWSVAQQKGELYNLNADVMRSAIPRKAKKASFHFRNEFIPSYKTQNIIGYIPGSQYPDSFIVFSAHYDHLGRMGKDTYFPGANDNASGIAMMLNLAKYYSENKPKYSIAFMAFGAEEAGLVGSKYYVEHPLFPLKQIKFLINTDLAGTGDDGITVVNGTIYNTEYKKLVKLNAQGSYLKEVKPRGKAANSDHYFFTEAGVKAFFIYTMGGIKAYHDVFDRPETLPLTEFEDYFRLINDFIGSLSNDHE